MGILTEQPIALSVADATGLIEALRQAKESSELSLIEVKAAIVARKDLGRPTTSGMDNKRAFMDYLDCVAREN